ncbi:unnamed protein product [Cuscuta campestris]|uniref:Calmodulin-binding domain-containing protein n=1 Tax=Cuscuta campestris TaxID=132261 RepID=A0A484L7D7_9ASTE|nr:unnamed protein product [Cuscuta campestris]
MAGESSSLTERKEFKKKGKLQGSVIRRFGSNKPSSSSSASSKPKRSSRFCCVYIDPSSSSGSSTPEKQSPVAQLQMPDFITMASPSSPCHDNKTAYYVQSVSLDQGEKILGEETNPADSSDSRSVKEEDEIKKVENFGSSGSFRRKGRSRNMKQAKPLSDEDSATGSESSATDDIEGKKGTSQASLNSFSESTSFGVSGHSQEILGPSDRKSLETLMRTSSLRDSFKSKRKPSFRYSRRVPKVKIADKATCSSTMRNSKFPENTTLKPGKSDSDVLQAYKVCSYHHCSLHGHSQDSSTPSKRHDARRKSIKLKKNIKQVKETKIDGDLDSESSNKTVNQPDTKKEKRMSMWNLIRRNMSSALAAESKNQSAPPEGSGLKADSLEEEMPTLDQGVKVLAVKLVREAIEKILLPEVSDFAPDQEILGKNHSEVEHNAPSGSEEMNTMIASSSEGQNTERTKEEVPNESDTRAPKHWSNLKKWILLQRFTKELERVRKLNTKKPRNVQVELDFEAEKVHLRHQTVEEKKRHEEWMIDYALQQAMSQLAPNQKRKVELLVKAFETMVPPQGDQQFQFTFPRPERKGKNHPLIKTETDMKSATESEQQSDKLNGGYLQDDGTANAQTETMVPPQGDKHFQFTSLKLENKGDDHPLIKSERDMKVATESGQLPDGLHGGYPKDVGTGNEQLGNRNYIKMWHMVSQHVLSGIASNTKSLLLDEADNDSEESIITAEKGDLDSRSFNRDDAIKLVKEAVNEILTTQIQDDSLDTGPDHTILNLGEKCLEECKLGTHGKDPRNDNLTENKGMGEPSLGKEQEEDNPELHKPNKWIKLRKLLVLKRSIMALQNARKIKLQKPQNLPMVPDPEQEKHDLRHRMMDERKKAHQWMLDYAVQHIVTKLTPARKKRVAMLVEAFEAVVPLP